MQILKVSYINSWVLEILREIDPKSLSKDSIQHD